MAEPLKSTIFEEREDLMISPTGGIPTLRTAHFLKPTSRSISGPKLKLPPLSLSLKWPVKAAFFGWRDPQKKWVSWVGHMHSMYDSVWEKSRIYEAIMASTYKIQKRPELNFGLAERWCCETNTFIFPWGEATITMEDMMVLGGYSVLGYPVSLPLEKRELAAIEETLENARKQLVKSSTQKAAHCSWLNHFMESGSEVEHEAFLSLWLSRFVFPGRPFDCVTNHVFSIAIHLARGIRIALAPAVLASLYRDLSLLKETIVASRELDFDSCEEDSYLSLTLWAPFLFVQIWGWERMPQLQPNPNFLNSGNLRLARWHGMKRSNVENVQFLIDSAGENFLWRPYAMALDKWEFPKFYKENEQWVLYNLELDEELESFFYCLRLCELVGLDCIEPYFPNRVALQFGMDQDLPGWVPRSMETREIVWNNYSRPIYDSKLYIPSRLFESDVTTRYLEWWRTFVLHPEDVIKPDVRKKRSARRSKRLKQVTRETNAGHDVYPPPGFSPKFVKCEGQTELHGISSSTNDVSPPPGFQPKHDNMMNGEGRLVRNDDETGNKLNDEGKAEPRGISSSTRANGDVKGMDLSMEKPVEKSVEGKDAIGRSETAVLERCNNIQIEAENSTEKMVGSSNNGQENSSSVTDEMEVLNLEVRVSRLERLFAAIKKERAGHKRRTHQ